MANRSNCRFGVLAIGILIAFASGRGRTDPTSQSFNLVKSSDHGAVVGLDLNTGRQKILVEPTGLWAHDITIAPVGGVIAYIEETPGVLGATGYDVPPRRILVILDNQGKNLRRLDNDVKEYVWSPDGTKVAYLSYIPCDPDYSLKCPAGVWVYDIPGSALTKIGERGYDLVWAKYNDCVYVREYRKSSVWCSNQDSLCPTAVQGIHFSSDGEFVIYEPIYEDDTPRGLFRSRDFQDITASLPTDLGAMGGWVFNSGHYLLFTKTDATVITEGDGPVKVIKSRTIHSIKHSIYDPEQRKIVRQFEGAISSWVGDGSRIIVERNGKVEFEEEP